MKRRSFSFNLGFLSGVLFLFFRYLFVMLGGAHDVPVYFFVGCGCYLDMFWGLGCSIVVASVKVLR